eukprot:tig00020552_g10479.t1
MNQHLASDAHKKRAAPAAREVPRRAVRVRMHVYPPHFGDAYGPPTRSVLCRYYATPEGCYRGDSCQFSHDPSLRQSSSESRAPAWNTTSLDLDSTVFEDWPLEAAAWGASSFAADEFPPLASPRTGPAPSSSPARPAGPSFAQAAAAAGAAFGRAAQPAPALPSQPRKPRPYRPPLRAGAPVPPSGDSCPNDGYDSSEEPPEYCLSKCCICHEKLASIRLGPCGHEVLCYFCVGRLRLNQWRTQASALAFRPPPPPPPIPSPNPPPAPLPSPPSPLPLGLPPLSFPSPPASPLPPPLSPPLPPHPPPSSDHILTLRSHPYPPQVAKGGRPQCPICNQAVSQVQRRRKEQEWEDPLGCWRCRELNRRVIRAAQVRFEPCGHLTTCLRCVRELETAAAAAGGARTLAACSCPAPGCGAPAASYGAPYDARPHPNSAPAPAMAPGPAE